MYSYFGTIEDLQNPNPISPDYILGLGNKRKKAEKKLKKAEKALRQGRTQKAERKLGKAIKKGGQVADSKRGNLAFKIKDVSDKILAENETKDKFIEDVSPQPIPTKIADIKKIDPSTIESAPAIDNSMPIASSGQNPINDDGTISGEVLPDVVVTNKKTNWLMVAVVIFAIVGIVLFLKRKK